MHRLTLVLTIYLILLWPKWAFANAGVPMLALIWPALWLTFLPVVLIEKEVLRHASDQPWKHTKYVALANLVSTMIGIPVVWFVMLGLEMAIGVGVSFLPESVSSSRLFEYALLPFMSAWAGPSANLWILYFSFVVFSVPFCVVSVLVEESILRRYGHQFEPGQLRRLVWRSNIYSYLFLILVGLEVPLFG